MAVGVFFTLPYRTHLRVLPGDDAYFYVGVIRDVGHAGLVDPQVAARPAYPLMAALLASVARASPWLAGAALPITLAIAFGLTAAALAARWRVREPGLAAFAALAATSGIAARLVAGKSENLLTLLLVCAILAIALWTRGRRRLVLIGAFALAAGLTEWPLVAALLGIVAADAAVRLVRRDREARGTLLPLWAGLLVGAGAAVLVVLLFTPGTLTIQNLPIAARYRSRFHNEVLLLVWPVTLILSVAGWWAARRVRRRETEAIHQLLSVWLALTALAGLVGLLGWSLPTYRAIAFALPVALATSAAAFLPRGLAGSGRRWPVAAATGVVAVGLAVLAVVPAAKLWYGETSVPISFTQLQEVRTAARYASALPRDRQTVLVVRLSLVHYLAYRRIAADTMPIDQGGRLLLYYGSVSGALEARPMRALKKENQAIVRFIEGPVLGALRNDAAIVTGRALSPNAFAHATASGRPAFGPGDVAVVRGPPAPTPLLGAPLPTPLLPPAAMGTFVAFSLAVLWLVGIGWSMLLLRGAAWQVRVALGPAFGVVAVPIVALVVERLGAPPDRVAGIAQLAALIAASAVAGAAAVARGRRGASSLAAAGPR